MGTRAKGGNSSQWREPVSLGRFTKVGLREEATLVGASLVETHEARRAAQKEQWAGGPGTDARERQARHGRITILASTATCSGGVTRGGRDCASATGP